MSSGIRIVVFATGLCGLAETALCDSLFDLPTLITDPQAEPPDRGIDAYLYLTQFYDTRLNGPAGNDVDWKYGDKAAPHATADGNHGPWDGYAISALGGSIYGESLDTSDTGISLPVNNKAIDFMQRFDGVASPKVGKVNAVVLGAGTLITGGDQTSKVGASDFDPTPAIDPRPSSKLGRIGQRLSILRAKLMGFLHRPGTSAVQPSQPQTDKVTGTPGSAR